MATDPTKALGLLQDINILIKAKIDSLKDSSDTATQAKKGKREGEKRK